MICRFLSHHRRLVLAIAMICMFSRILSFPLPWIIQVLLSSVPFTMMNVWVCTPIPVWSPFRSKCPILPSRQFSLRWDKVVYLASQRIFPISPTLLIFKTLQTFTRFMIRPLFTRTLSLPIRNNHNIPGSPGSPKNLRSSRKLNKTQQNPRNHRTQQNNLNRIPTIP